MIFSHVLYQLSYLGTVGRSTRGRTRNDITQVRADTSMRVPQAPRRNAGSQCVNLPIGKSVNLRDSAFIFLLLRLLIETNARPAAIADLLFGGAFVFVSVG